MALEATGRGPIPRDLTNSFIYYLPNFICMFTRIRTAFLQILVRLGLFPLYVLLHGYIMRLRGHLIYVSRLPDASGDYVCDGVNDEVQINAAIDYVAKRRGRGQRVINLRGEFICEGGVVMSVKNLRLQGISPRETKIIYKDSLWPITRILRRNEDVRVRRMCK